MGTACKSLLCLSLLLIMMGCAEDVVENSPNVQMSMMTRSCIQDEEENIDYDALWDLFEEDRRVLDSLYVNMSEHEVSPAVVIPPFSKVVQYSLMPSATTMRIDKLLVLAKANLYTQLQEEIDRYVSDIHSIYGCEITLITVDNENHLTIKNLIHSYQNALDGVILIGNIAYARFEKVEDNVNTTWPCDLYYTDLNGTWGDSDSDGIYDSHTGNIMPEIFLGRISAKGMEQVIPEITCLRRYFNKNHAFWSGATEVRWGTALAYTDEDWVDFTYFSTSIQNLYGTATAKKYGDVNFGRAEYLSLLQSPAYEFIQLACHASPDYLAMTGGGIWSDEIYYNGSNAIAYNLFCCSACDWTRGTSNGYLAGSYIFNTSPKGLVVVGSTKTGSMLKFSNFYIPLRYGKTIGEALKEWWHSIVDEPDDYRISWFYGMTIIGDPMIYMFHRTL